LSGGLSAIAIPSLAVAALIASSSSAQVPLSSYADKNGYVDVQKLTCAQLAGTFQEDADLLAAGIAVGTTAWPRSTAPRSAGSRTIFIW